MDIINNPNITISFDLNTHNGVDTTVLDDSTYFFKKEAS